MTRKTEIQEKFINRDISWLEFNSRVLDEAADKGNPLLERLKFIAIFSNNLDEFFMVRIAAIAQQRGTQFQKIYKDYGYDPEELILRLDRRVRVLVEKQYRHLNGEILPELEKEGIHLITWDRLTPSQKNTAMKIMSSELCPVLTPIGVDQSHPFPLVPNLGLEMLIRLKKEGDADERFALLEVPSVMPRFIQLENSPHGVFYISAEEIIANNLDMLFSGCKILERSMFRVTRDMDFSIDEDSISDLLSEMQIALQKKTKRAPVRVEVSAGMSRKSKAWLTDKLKANPDSFYSINGIISLKAMFTLSSLHGFPHLVNRELPPLPSIHCDEKKSMFAQMREKCPFIVHLPYESFNPVVKLLEEAADDPNVLAIKQTLYRVSGNSPVVKALIRAARNGKQVSVLFEIKARFDEENNINWSMELAEAGAHVVYGIAGLKVHCKALLVIRREDDGIMRYVHLSTGNYNDRTAKQYTDVGYFSTDKALATDVSALFNVITGFSSPPVWNMLIVAPFNMREKLIFLIDRESRMSTPENPGRIIMKINALIDYEIIEHLYAAAEKNVKIDLIVRGICSMNPYWLKPEFASNIRVISILDRYLEHSRIYYFYNNGSPEYYMGSSDVMPRNIRRRIELLFPVSSQAIRSELDFILETAMNDARKGRHLNGPNQYSRTLEMGRYEKTRSQNVLYEYYAERYAKFKESSKPANGNITVFRKPNNSTQG